MPTVKLSDTVDIFAETVGKLTGGTLIEEGAWFLLITLHLLATLWLPLLRAVPRRGVEIDKGELVSYLPVCVPGQYYPLFFV